jgi:hypothetical protein
VGAVAAGFVVIIIASVVCLIRSLPPPQKAGMLAQLKVL